MKEIMEKENKILFIGDSITDVNRDRMDERDLGDGFPKLIADRLSEKYPEAKFNVLNRGIGGDQVDDLTSRWTTDCLDLEPDVVTILVGINDVFFTEDIESTPSAHDLETFESNYRSLLDPLADGTEIILMEPFVLPYPADRLNWRQQLDPRIQIVRRLAKEYNALLVPLDGILNAKGIADSFQAYTGEDGIHPTVKGHRVIADAWFACIDGL